MFCVMLGLTREYISNGIIVVIRMNIYGVNMSVRAWGVYCYSLFYSTLPQYCVGIVDANKDINV